LAIALWLRIGHPTLEVPLRSGAAWTAEAVELLDLLAADEARLLGGEDGVPGTSEFAKLLAPDRSHSAGTSRLREADALRAILDSRVVIIADVHTNPMIALTAASTLERCMRTDEPGGRSVSVLFELLPASAAAELSDAAAALRRGDEAGLRGLLNRNVPFPTSGYSAFLRTALIGGATVTCMWNDDSRLFLPEELTDPDRSIFHPRATWAGPVMLRPMSSRIADSNADFVREVTRSISDAPTKSRHVWAMVGCSHVFGPEGIATVLDGRGIRTTVIVGQSDQLDAVALRDGRADWIDSWLQLAPGVLRAPVEGGVEARRRRWALATSLDRWRPRLGSKR
jgi:hypothetical protein